MSQLLGRKRTLSWLFGRPELLAFSILLASTRSFALDLWREGGALMVLTAAPILILGGLLSYTRLHRAEPWAQLSWTDRALSVLGIIPAAPIAFAAIIIAAPICWGVLTIAHFSMKPRDRTHRNLAARYFLRWGPRETETR